MIKFSKFNNFGSLKKKNLFENLKKFNSTIWQIKNLQLGILDDG